MPRKSKSVSDTPSGKSSRAAKPQFKGFINYSPTSDDKRGFSAYHADSNDIIYELDNVLDDSYKLSVTVDKSNSAVVASLFDQHPTRGSGGYILSSRGSDAFTAIRRVLYLHVIVLEGEWLAAMDTTDPDAW